MCSFNILKIVNNAIDFINFHAQKRGPDETIIKEINNITFVHNLLHITGEKTLQPFVKDNIACVYNGEIYNYLQAGNYKSDGECIIDLYMKHGIEFTKKLDGEFAIAIIDFNKNIILMSTDIFSTKPLFYSFENDNFMISSYSSCIERNKMGNIKKLEANKTIIFDLNTFEKKNETTVYDFDLNQHKTNFDDWNKAFENAIRKRTSNLKKKLFVSLSSGYDSGSICCALNKLNINYKTYTVNGKEDRMTLLERFHVNNTDNECYDLNEQIVNKHMERNKLNCCDYLQLVRKNIRKPPYGVLKDKASAGGSFIYNNARKDNYIVSLSGQGADEILSDYGFNGQKITWHSCFGGKFPNDLKTIFPWESFFSGIGQCLLMKEEIIGGSYGIEQRYPFLDKDVVQEFLWLTADLKNKYYKSPLHNYMSINKYPFLPNTKVGFNRLY